jgi:hypothetical protein
MLEFHTWYLKEKGWIQRTDSGGYAITVEGIDVLEQSGLSLGKDFLLPGPDTSPECTTEEGGAAIDLTEITPSGSGCVRKRPQRAREPGGAAPADG